MNSECLQHTCSNLPERNVKSLRSCWIKLAWLLITFVWLLIILPWLLIVVSIARMLLVRLLIILAWVLILVSIARMFGPSIFPTKLEVQLEYISTHLLPLGALMEKL